MDNRDFVLVTGASSGIGRETAIILSKHYNVIAAGRDTDRLLNTLQQFHEGTHLMWQYDLSDVINLENSLKSFLADNGVMISRLVHCAGYMRTIPIKMLSVATLQESFNVNVIAAALLVKTLVSKKANNKALKSAVFISSNISNFGAKAFSAYSSSKAGLDGLMRSLAMELAPDVRVNSVLPGGVRTAMTEHMYQDEQLIRRMEESYPLGLGVPSDIGNAVEFLLSDKSRWITGQQLTVDGGRTVNITG